VFCKLQFLPNLDTYTLPGGLYDYRMSVCGSTAEVYLSLFVQKAQKHNMSITYSGQDRRP